MNELTIVSMSFGYEFGIDLITLATERIVKSGIFAVASAGNENTYSYRAPTISPFVFTVASSDIFDERSDFSNFGTKVDIFSPGSNIVSCDKNGGVIMKSGTSMAAPLAAGFISAVASAHRVSFPEDIRRVLKDYINKDVINYSKSNNNHLFYDGNHKLLIGRVPSNDDNIQIPSNDDENKISNDESKSDKGLNIKIILIVSGIVVACCLIGIGIYCFIKRKQEQNQDYKVFSQYII